VREKENVTHTKKTSAVLWTSILLTLVASTFQAKKTKQKRNPKKKEEGLPLIV